MKKRIIRLLLAVVMIVGMIPIGIISSFAENTEVVQYRSLDVSAGAYIDTGFIPTSKTMVIFEAEVGKTQNGAAVFGVCYYADGNNYSFHVNSNQTNFGTGFGPRMSWANAPIRNGLQSIQLDTNLLTLDGKEVTYPDPDPSDPNYPKNIKEETYTFDHTKNGGLPLYLFAINFFGNEVQTFPEQFIRFYSCKIYDDYNLVREYVPARCGSEFGVYDRVEKKFCPKQGYGSMVGYKSFYSYQTLESGNEGVLLDLDSTVVISKDTTINALPGQSAICIGNYANVTIEILEGVTLTVNGGDAVGRTGAGAGIEVPETASLTICGKGTLIATGGDAAVGEVGGKGGDAKIVPDDPTHEKYDWIYTGVGGRGGNGGGGAGAGIGGRGGFGGLGGAGGAGLSVEAWSDHNGNRGSDGSDGYAGFGCGSITICDTVSSVTATGGKAFDTTTSSRGGNCGTSTDYEWYNVYYACGGGGGGAGGNGYAAADIGSGGAGAGGGGGGGSGLVVWWNGFYDVTGTGHAGQGGIGFINGSAGSDKGAEENTSTYLAGGGGNGGNSGGGEGTEKRVKKLEPIEIPKARDLVYNGREQEGVSTPIRLIYGLEYIDLTETSGNKGTEPGIYYANLKLIDGFCWEDGSIAPKQIYWEIKKIIVDVPDDRTSFCYTGKEFGFPSTDLYTVEGGIETEIGNYTAELNLKDWYHYQWSNSFEDIITLPFDIHQYVDDDDNGICDICHEDIPYVENISYLDRTVNGDGYVITEEKTLDFAWTVTDSTVELGTPGETVWYVLKRNITFQNRPVVKGDVRLILMDNCTLTANNGITVEEGNSLRIYAQSDDKSKMGILTADTQGVTAIGGKNGEDSPAIDATANECGIPGGDGITAGDVYIYGGIISLKSSGAACIGGGNGGKGGDIKIFILIEGFSGVAGNGGNGGDSGKVYLYGGNTLLENDDYVCIGGGIAGNPGLAYSYFDGGRLQNRDGKEGKSGTLITGYWNAFESPVIKVGTSEQDAEEDTEYGDQQYLSVHFHVWEPVNSLIHRCSECGAETSHTDDGNCFCIYCGQRIFIVIYEEAATCTGKGHIVYYQYENIFYSDEERTKVIANLDNWLNTTIQNGGGMIPAKGHTWENFSDYEHRCKVCYELEEHTAAADYTCTDCGHGIVHLAKADAIKAIKEAAGDSTDMFVTALVNAAVAEINKEATDTVAKVIEIKNKGTAAIEKQLGGTATHTHTFADTYSHDEKYHWYACTCGHSAVDCFGEHTFGEGVVDGNKTTYTCVCGYTKVVYDKPDDEGEIIGGTTYTGISLTLGSDISINFYMNLTEDARQNGTMTFDIGGRIVTLKGTDAKYNSTEKKYNFSTPLTALEMAETVTATFTYNGVDYVQEYSVAEYIDTIVGNSDKYGKEAVALAKKIANYGYYAQVYLASIHSNVQIVDSGEGYDRMFKFGGDFDIDVEKAIEALANYKVTVSGTSDNLSLYGSTVYFDSATALNYYVTVKNGVKPTATAVNTKTGKEKDVEIKLYKDNIYIVSVKDITATELADDIEVVINNEITLTGSVFAYCNSVVKAHSFDGATEKDTFAVNAMTAFYEYYKAAMEYISFELHFDMPEHYKVFTADGEEITGDTTVKCYRTFSFRLVPDENYKISRVISGWDIEPDENGLYTVSYVGGKHDVAVYTKIDSYCLTVTVEGEDAGEMPDTKISFVCDGDETIYAQCFAPGIYEIEIPKGKSGTIVVEKSGYKEYSQEFTADGKVEEITVNLIPND